MSRVLAIPDLHAPCMRRKFPSFLAHTAKKWKTDKVVILGDVADNHLCSTHTKEHDALSPVQEVKATRKQIQQVYDLFPDAIVCEGNHDSRPHLRAAEILMPREYLRDFNDVWGTPKWEWVLETTIDGVCYTHGTGTSGKNAALSLAMSRMESAVIGHVHAFAGVQWVAGPRKAIFGMNCGCGMDENSYGARYGLTCRWKSLW